MTPDLTPRRLTLGRLVSAVALIAVGAVVVLVLVGGGSAYTLHAQFPDAGGLVKGGAVEVAGRPVGHVSDVDITPDGLADVTLSLDDDAVTPVRRGTRAAIRALGQAGVANHYVQLSPGMADGPALASGSVLPPTQTSGLVNYDAILDSFGPQQRANLQELVANGAKLYAGSGSRYFNEMLGRFDPAARELSRFAGDLARDRHALRDVVSTGATTAKALASRRPDLMAAVGNTARTLDALATQRRALGDSLDRAPAVLDQARRTLAKAGTAITELRPALRDVPPAAKPLHGFLVRVNRTLPPATSAATKLRAQLPNLKQTLNGLRPLAPRASGALTSAAKALDASKPVVRAFRYYGADFLLGVFQGLIGVATANHDRWGHYGRLEFTQPYQSSLGGAFPNPFEHPLLPQLFDLRSGLDRRCPGGNSPPAPDGSSPWVLPASICSATDDVSPDVNHP